MTTVTPPPGFPLDPPASARWQEPTRRHLFSGRYDYSGRYVASLVILLFAVYLQINTNFAQLVQFTAFQHGGDGDVTALFAFQFAFGVVCFLAAFLIAPTTLSRRLTAVAVTIVLFLLWAILFAGRLTGAIAFPGGPYFSSLLSSTLVAPAYVGVLIAVIGWLIVRERPGLSYLVLIVIPFIGVIAFALAINGITAGLSQLVITTVATIVGVGAAWAARGLATLVQHPAWPA